MEYYSVIIKNEILLFAATWMDLENIILSEVSQPEKDKYYDITYMQNLKNNTNEFIYKTETDQFGKILQKEKKKEKTETDSEIQKTNLWLPKGKGGGRDKLGVWD